LVGGTVISGAVARAHAFRLRRRATAMIIGSFPFQLLNVLREFEPLICRLVECSLFRRVFRSDGPQVRVSI
jgi:hypothetical protein